MHTKKNLKPDKKEISKCVEIVEEDGEEKQMNIEGKKRSILVPSPNIHFYSTHCNLLDHY